MNMRQAWVSNTKQVLAALFMGSCCSIAFGQAPSNIHSIESVRTFEELTDLQQFLGRVQERTKDLTLSRGVATRADKALNAARLGEQLLEGECLYAVGESTPQTYSVWVLSRQGVGLHRAPVSLQTVTEGLAAWQRQQVSLSAVKARAPLPRGVQRTDTTLGAASAHVPAPTAEQITQWLFPPTLRSRLNSCEHLTLLVPGAMATLPWAALPYDAKSLVIDRFSISLLPDLHALGRIRSKSGSKDTGQLRASGVNYVLESALVMGNPRYNDPEWVFPNLPGAQREATSIGQGVAKTHLLLGEQATKANAQIELQRQRWDMLYMATHAVSDRQQPLDRSFVALTPVTSSQSDNLSGRWTAREVQNLKLKVDMAVLSACQTGLGGEHDAGIIGIGRAFFLAGVPHVITSLWSVDDDATADLMTHFVQHIKLNSTPKYFPADSLRKAMLQSKLDGRPVGHWASFVHFGVVNVFTDPAND